MPSPKTNLKTSLKISSEVIAPFNDPDKAVESYVSRAKAAELMAKDSAKDTGVRKGLTSDR